MKKIITTLLALAVAFAMMPCTAFADEAPEKNVQGHKINFEISDSTKEFNASESDIYVRLDMSYDSGTETGKSILVYLMYDADKITPVFCPKYGDAESGVYGGQDAAQYLHDFTENVVFLAENRFAEIDYNSEIKLYEKIENGKGYICWKWSDLRDAERRSGLEDVLLSSVYFKVNGEKYKSYDDFAKAVNSGIIIKVIPSDTEANAAGLNASCTARISATGMWNEDLTYYYGASTLKGDGTLTAGNFSVKALIDEEPSIYIPSGPSISVTDKTEDKVYVKPAIAKKVEAMSVNITKSSYSKKKNTYTIKFNKSNSKIKVDGYQIWRSVKKNSGYKKIKTTTSKTFTDKTIKHMKTYYYKVRGYRTIDGKKYYTGFSPKRKVTTK